MFSFRKALEIIWILIIIAFFVVSIYVIKDGSLENKLESIGILAPIVFVLAKASTLVIAPLGGMPLYFLGGSLFGSTYGFILALLGDVLGSTISFLLSKFYGTRMIKILAGPRLLTKIVDTVSILNSTRSFIKARITFILMPEILAYAAGLSKLNFFTFSLINTLFYLPVDFVLVFFGSQVITLVTKHTVLFYSSYLLIFIIGFWLLQKEYKNKNLDNTEGM